ncbi:MAG: anthranilate phosphoribosyltransferase [bacterium]|nr:anthranilate phosphoribosyltransferase [bacterium]
MIKEAIAQIIAGKDLSREEAVEVMREVMDGMATDAQIAAFITALRMKGETVEEITGFTQVMREKAEKVVVSSPVLDTCGTGGDGAYTFNISTATAFVAAGAGAVVAKHGNRSVSSMCGSADCLAALGIEIMAEPPIVEKCLREAGIGFFFAPLWHKSMKYAIGPRKEIGIRTVFNILGPMTNPAGAKCQLLGVYDQALVSPLAHVLKNLGSSRAMVVHGLDGLDEITTTSRTKVSELKDNGSVVDYELDPRDFGLPLAKKEDLVGGSVEDNVRIVTEVLQGKPGPARDIVLLNAGAAIYVYGLAENLSEGIDLAARSIDTGAALAKLDLLRQCIQQGMN